MASSSLRVTEKSSLQHDGSLGTSWWADRLRQLFSGEEALGAVFGISFLKLYFFGVHCVARSNSSMM
eukprot:5221066-Karenia_brevis.AAC.1